MFKINADYSDYYDATDSDFPVGKAIDATTADSIDGTPWLAKYFNQINGFFQALWYKAFGNFTGISGKPDNINVSDGLKAILQIIETSQLNIIKVVTINGSETTIPWSDLGITYSGSKNYATFVTSTGKNIDFLPFNSWAESDGVHIYARHYDADGNIIAGTPFITWGGSNWGDFKWGKNVDMKVNLIIKEVA